MQRGINMMIGSLLKEYRLKQNKSQRKFIGSIVTQSYYSKVEKNISQITADNLIGLLQYNNISVQEFFNSFSQKSDNSYRQTKELENMMIEAYYTNNIEQMHNIKKIIQESTLSEYDKNYQTLMTNGLLALMNPKLNSEKLTSTIKNKIFDSPSYTQDKLMLYCDFMQFYSLSDNEIITRNILKQYQSTNDSNIQELILAIVCNILIFSIENDKFENVSYFLNKIQNIKTTPQLLFYKIDIEFFKNIIKIKNSNDAKKINKCKNIIKTLQDAGMKEYSNELKKFIKLY
ncbi:Rgg/GadR/MutR family transcriptional regulator [Lactobacillus helveticus]|nr:Rgg/GadR/MutR family transcriptional regulator [Lactobacillus helveticus]MCT3411227.1 Rgg/GadR/MutR family transcriptional regulator [Lactobacillus helveticus]MCT3432397.1 Rgg/GadR/MutR family transcriptional regulator [Lactobacillus helveticus]MCT3433647.1 Rgg/GadR/MutR family transcriptional regulator [Lactobacillus helveticus]